jgi:hypothetical protein
MREEPSERAPENSPRPWRIHFSWYAVFLLGWLLYECTAQPGLAAAVTCAKFGWSDWRVACWLRRVDPDWRRGQTCFWFYLAYGLWKVAVMSVVVIFLLALAGSMVRRPPVWAQGGGMPPAAVGVLIAAGLGLGLSFFATYVSVWSALRNGVKVWLGAAPHQARVRKYWPPSSGQHNAAPLVTITTLIVTLWVGVFAAALVSLGLGPAVAGVTPLALLVVASSLTVFVFKYLERRIFARSPTQCWPPEELEPVYQVEDPEAVIEG